MNNVFGLPIHQRRQRLDQEWVDGLGWQVVVRNYQALNHIAAGLGAIGIGFVQHYGRTVAARNPSPTGQTTITSHFRQKKNPSVPATNKGKKRLRDTEGIPERDRARGLGGPPRKQQKMANHNNGDEVPVTPVPPRIATTIPDHITVKLRYADQWEIKTSAAHASAPIIYKLNNCENPYFSAPNATGSGHNPMGWSKYTPIFNYYRVMGSRYKFTIVNMDDSTIVAGLYWNDDSADSIAKTTALMESKYSKHVIMPAPVSANTPSVATLTHEYSPGSIKHHVRNVDTEDRWTNIGTAPSLVHFLHMRLYHWRDQDTTPTFNAQVFVEAEFIVQFKEAKPEIYWDNSEDFQQAA